MDRKNLGLTIVTQPQEFFRELISETFKNLKVRVLPETEFYLVNLLNQFMTTDNLYLRDASGLRKEEPLVIMLKEAFEEDSPEGRKLMFRKVGDVSLYMAGFFQDHISQRLVDIDYYIGMGGTAYQQAATLALESPMRPAFGELAERFDVFVDVLADVSEKTTIPTEQTEKDLIRTYDYWQKTQSLRAEKILEKAGIIPPKAIKKPKPDLQ